MSDPREGGLGEAALGKAAPGWAGNCSARAEAFRLDSCWGRDIFFDHADLRVRL
jgi:hypothetical protein